MKKGEKRYRLLEKTEKNQKDVGEEGGKQRQADVHKNNKKEDGIFMIHIVIETSGGVQYADPEKVEMKACKKAEELYFLLEKYILSERNGETKNLSDNEEQNQIFSIL